MKRSAVTFVMLAGLGGCVSPSGDTAPGAKPFGSARIGQESKNLMGPGGEPVITTAAGQMPSGKESSGVTRADARMPAGKTASNIKQTAGFARVMGNGGAHVSGLGASCADGSCGVPSGPQLSPFGPVNSPFTMGMGQGGILPAPAFGVPGAVAAVGALPGNGMGGMYGPMYPNQRSMIRFANPTGMKVSWQGADGSFVEPLALESPAKYAFPQASIYRLRLSGIAKYPGKVYYPTLEIYPATPKTITFLSHTTVPVSFTDEDFEQVNSGNLVTKVIYLPDALYQDAGAVAGVTDEVISTRLEAGVNPIDEANRRGTILAVIRVGNIDLQDPNSPGMNVPPGMMAAPAPRMNVAPVAPAAPGSSMAPGTLPSLKSDTKAISLPIGQIR
jgi:hypothetical protein